MATLFVCLQDLGIVQTPQALLSDRARLVHSIEASIKAHDLLKGSPGKSLQGALGLEQWGRWNRENRDALTRIPEPNSSIAAYIAAWAGRGSS